MAKRIYRCTAVVTGSKYLGDVEAESEEKAIELAWELQTAHVSMCHQCSDQCEDPEIQGILVDVIE